MEKIIGLHWHDMFVPTVSLLEIFIRGTITYWVIYLLMRFFRRGTGQLGISDLLLITMVSDAAQNSMAGEYNSISEGILLVVTLFTWDYVIDYLGYKKIMFTKFVHPDPILLIRNGKLHHANMEKQLISEEELMGLLRENDVDDFKKVKTCYLESTGNISVVLL